MGPTTPDATSPPSPDAAVCDPGDERTAAVYYGRCEDTTLELAPGQVPSIVRLELGGLCSGAVVAPRWVLSAAHYAGRPTLTCSLGWVPREAVTFHRPRDGTLTLSRTLEGAPEAIALSGLPRWLGETGRAPGDRLLAVLARGLRSDEPGARDRGAPRDRHRGLARWRSRARRPRRVFERRPSMPEGLADKVAPLR